MVNRKRSNVSQAQHMCEFIAHEFLHFISFKKTEEQNFLMSSEDNEFT